MTVQVEQCERFLEREDLSCAERSLELRLQLLTLLGSPLEAYRRAGQEEEEEHPV